MSYKNPLIEFRNKALKKNKNVCSICGAKADTVTLTPLFMVRLCEKKPFKGGEVKVVCLHCLHTRDKLTNKHPYMSISPDGEIIEYK